MTQQQFEELKSLIDRNYEMVGRIYEEHGGRLDRVDGRLEGLEGRMTGFEGRLTRVEVGQEQLSHDGRAVAEGVTGNAARLERLEGSFDRFEASFDHFSANVSASYADHEQRLRSLED